MSDNYALKRLYIEARLAGDTTKANELWTQLQTPDPLACNTGPDGSVRLCFLTDDDPEPAPEPGLNTIRFKLHKTTTEEE